MKKDNSKKIILDLCGGTGSWSKPYKDAGYDVRILTLPEFDITDVLLSVDYICFYRAGYKIVRIPYDGIYGILAAPTCTMFSLARTTAKTPRDFDEGMRLVSACLNIIWAARARGSLKFWALENPLGYLRQFLGKPALTFDPCDYGDTYTKKTDLWGYFNEPLKCKRLLSEKEKALCAVNSRVLPDLPGDYVLPIGFSSRAARRSMTSKYFAEAFFKVNK